MIRLPCHFCRAFYNMEKNVKNNVHIGWVSSAVRILLLAMIFFVALNLITGSLKFMGRDTVHEYLSAADNPFVALFIGLLATAIIQSSSTITSVVVALAATGSIGFETAVPIVLGANIGTTLTGFLVSLVFIGRKREFRKALTVASSHNFFNVFLVLILFPLEYFYGSISGAARYLASIIGVNQANAEISKNSFSLSSSAVEFFGSGAVVLIIAIVLLVFSIKLLAKFIYNLLVERRKSDFGLLMKNPYKSFSLGLLLTAGIQSSSVTTSFAVAVAATGKISAKKLFPFIMGANVGTTVTAFVATLFKSEAALAIAFVHLIFNVVGVLIFLPFPPLRNIPVFIALRFSAMTSKNRFIGFTYFLIIFFILPFILIYFNGV